MVVHRIRRAVLAPLAPILAAAAVLAVPAGAAHAADNGSWSVRPATAAGTPAGASAREYFFLEAKPGATVHDAVAITNDTAAPLTFKVYGADAYNTPRDGGFALRGVKDPQKEIGAWTTVAQPLVTVPPGATINDPVTIVVPPGATPGDHVGGISVMNTAIEYVQQAGNVRVGVQRIVAARLFLRVAGALVPGLSVTQLHLSAGQAFPAYLSSADGTLTYVVRNTGNVRLDPQVTVNATGAFGRTLVSGSPVNLPELLPGQQATFTWKWRGVPPLDAATVQVNVTAAGFTGTAQTSYLAIPWETLLLLAGIIGLAIGGLWRARRRRGVPKESPESLGEAVGAAS